ncbi:MAG: hypothetical protein AAGA86_13555 [Bacteroidota bacterium]
MREIAKDTLSTIVKQSNGLDINELKKEGYYGTDDRSMMMQWGMEAFTNPEIIRNTMKTIRTHKMFTNEFLGGFKVLDFSLVRWSHLEPAIARFLNPQTNGVAIQRGNTYTYRTKDHSVYAAQNHHPGDYASQQHVAGMNVGDHFSIFHNHPAVEKDVDFHSPNYWLAYGRFPHVAQHENINLSIYNIPEKKGKIEMDLLDYTHAWFPQKKFDTTIVEGNYAFGKKDDIYCALIGASQLAYRDSENDDLIQKGKKSFWIIEAGSKSENGSFEAFVQQIKNNKVVFDTNGLKLNYGSNNKDLELVFGEDFKVNGHVVNTEYMRYDSPYIKAERKAKTLTFKHNNKTLFLDFENLIRKF